MRAQRQMKRRGRDVGDVERFPDVGILEHGNVFNMLLTTELRLSLRP